MSNQSALYCYINRLESLETEIEQHLECINTVNFEKKLETFGYKFICLDNQMTKDCIDKKLSKINQFPGVYIFEDRIKDCFTKENWKSFKKNMGSNKVPGWNCSSDKDNNILYIGKSNSIGQRVKEHITTAAKSTYALKIKNFDEFIENKGLNLNYSVKIFYLEIDKDVNKGKAVTELVESFLHSNLSPKIGTSR